MTKEEFKNNFETLTWEHDPNNKRVNLRQYAQEICDLFEDLLDQNDITVPDECREGREEEGRLYGMSYDDLLEDTIGVLQEMVREIGVMLFEKGDQNAKSEGLLGRMDQDCDERSKRLSGRPSDDAGL